jgi:ubiquitin-activating enzyme E1
MRCSVLKKKIMELNPQVKIICNSFDNLQDSNVIICVNQSTKQIIKYNKLCRKNNIKFISLQSSNNKGILFVDAGDNHIVSNITGENYEPIQVLSCDKEFVFTTNGHDFQSGDTIKFSNLQGTNLEFLNNEFSIIVNDKKSFKLVSKIPNDFNFINGTVSYVDIPIVINHQNYETQIINPTMNFLSDSDIIKNYVSVINPFSIINFTHLFLFN